MTTYYLEALYDSAKSFYNKARVNIEEGRTSLISYSTVVATIEEGNAVINGTYSATTLRHIKEFLKQEGFEVGTKKELIKMYMKEEGL